MKAILVKRYMYFKAGSSSKLKQEFFFFLLPCPSFRTKGNHLFKGKDSKSLNLHIYSSPETLCRAKAAKSIDLQCFMIMISSKGSPEMKR